MKEPKEKKRAPSSPASQARLLSRVTAEKDRLQAELLGREQFYREILNATSEAIAVEDTLSGSFVEVNDPMVRMYGYSSREDLLARSIGDLSVCIPPYTQEEALRRNDLAVAGVPQIFEWIARKKSGELFNVEVSLTCSPIRGKNRVLAVVRDITERKLAQENLKRSHDELESRVKQRTEELREKNAALDQKVRQLRKLTMELTQAEERERKRLAAKLHDGVQPFLVAATIRISLLDQEASAEEHAQTVRQVLDLMGEALNASRALTTDLYPPVLLDGGFLPGLHWLADWMESKFGLKVALVSEGVSNVPEPLVIMLFEAVRELLVNVVKHARVNAASVAVSQPDEKTIRVLVSDGGIGLSADKRVPPFPPSGLGLFHLRERLACMGGSLDIASAPDQGTRVSVTVPIG